MANHYIRAGATGTADGSDWTNAFTHIPKNALHATGAFLTRGDTYYVASGDYSDVSISYNTAASGALVITFKKATVADHGTETGWSDAYATGQAVFGNAALSTGYWTFDGATGGGPGAWDSGHGFKFITAPAASIFGSGIVNQDVSFVTLRHAETTTTSVGDTGGSAITANSTGGYYASDWLIEYCYCHDSAGGFISFQGGTNATIQYCFMSRNRSTA